MEINPQPGDHVRPLVSLGGKHALAGGWCRFTEVEVLQSSGPVTIQAADLPNDVLARLTAPRAQIAGLDMASPKVMGILNVTPDSFSDGGQFLSPDKAVDRAMAMVRDGADILDIGGESTRPGAQEVGTDQELARTVPVIEAIRARCDVAMSIDTRKAVVGKAALAAGANLVNDVSAFSFDAALADVTAAANAPVCLMHAQGMPDTMQVNPTYGDVVAEVTDALAQRVDFAKSKGIPGDQIITDPGIGFGKTMDHNLLLLRSVSVLHGLGCPILVGASRKRFIGTLTGVSAADDRVAGSVAVALAAVAQGVQIVRVHDVAETRQAITMWMAVHSGV